MDYPIPSTCRELRFLGMVGYYHGFYRNFSTIMHPLTQLLNPTQRFEWTTKCQNAFQNAKDLLCHAPVLLAAELTKPLKLEVDASAVGPGGVLLQKDERGFDYPI